MDVRARDAAVGTRRPFQLPVGEVVDGPTGACDRVLIGSNPRPAFSATVGEFGCGTFAAAPPPPADAEGRRLRYDLAGWPRRLGDNEEAIPTRFLQEDLDL